MGVGWGRRCSLDGVGDGELEEVFCDLSGVDPVAGGVFGAWPGADGDGGVGDGCGVEFLGELLVGGGPSVEDEDAVGGVFLGGEEFYEGVEGGGGGLFDFGEGVEDGVEVVVVGVGRDGFWVW